MPHETIFAQVCRLPLLQLKGMVIFEALWCKFKLCLHHIKHSSAGIATIHRGSPARMATVHPKFLALLTHCLLLIFTQSTVP